MTQPNIVIQDPPAIVVYLTAFGLAVLLSLVCSWGLTVIIKRRRQQETDYTSALSLSPIEALEELKSKIVSLQTLSSAGANDEQAFSNLRSYVAECLRLFPDLTKPLLDWNNQLTVKRENPDKFLITLMEFQRWTSQQIKGLS